MKFIVQVVSTGLVVLDTKFQFLVVVALLEDHIFSPPQVLVVS